MAMKTTNINCYKLVMMRGVAKKRLNPACLTGKLVIKLLQTYFEYERLCVIWMLNIKKNRWQNNGIVSQS